MTVDPDRIVWDDRGLVPAVVTDRGRVLMLAWMNREALEATLATGLVHFWSRSRQRLWRKGETSGNHLRLVEVTPDCDGDTLLVEARPAGPVCHTGTDTCFGDRSPGFGFLDGLWEVVRSRREDPPAGSYTARLLAGGPDLPLRKLAEETTEVVLAAKDHAAGRGDSERLAEEVADLLYHLLVVLADRDLDPAMVIRILADRAGFSDPS
jgi:phosphoribosyl-ATP pyrophosphohydrolase/phosphoribosyl-AMP cyclohydrolase